MKIASTKNNADPPTKQFGGSVNFSCASHDLSQIPKWL